MCNFFIHADGHIGLSFKWLAMDLHTLGSIMRREEKECRLATSQGLIVYTLDQNRKAGAEELPFLDDE